MKSVTVVPPTATHMSFRWEADGRPNRYWSAYVLPSGTQLTPERVTVSELREQARHTYIYVGLRVSSIEDGT